MADDAVAAAKRQRRCTGEGGDMMSALPEHLLLEVLSRVGTVKDLFMFAVTCRRWLARFTDRTFLHDLLQCPTQDQDHGRGLLGFFLQDARQRGMMEMTRKDAAAELASAFSFLPVPGHGWAPLGLDAHTMPRALTSSFGAFDYTVPLAARRGIVLMQLVRRRSDTRLLLGVCNPVTGQRHLLAPLDTGSTNICSYTIITAADVHNAAAGRYTFSQLLVATVKFSTSDWAVHLHSYSATTRRWSAPATLHLVKDRRDSLVDQMQRSTVVHHGAVHWLWPYDGNDTGDDGDGDRALPPARRRDDGSRSLYKLSVPLGGEAAGGGHVCFAFTRIPVRVRAGGNPLLVVTGDGDLAVVCVYRLHVSVFTCRPQQQAGGHGDEEAWERSASFMIPGAMPYPDIHSVWQPKERWYDLSKGSSMLVMYRSSAVSIVDLHSKTMEKVMDCFLPPMWTDRKDLVAVPYEMDLVEFFVLQLGGLRSAGSSG